MDMELRSKNKKFGIKRLFRSVKYSCDGLAYAIKNEQSIFIMTVCLILTIAFGIFFKISPTEWLFVFVSIGLVLGTELLNTAIEATIDIISPEYHPIAKIAKDTASASVFVYSCIAFIIGCMVFIPNIIKFIERM